MSKPETWGANVNDFKSHSSWLYNDRLAILFFQLDMDSLKLNSEKTNIDLIKKVYAYNLQIYKNVRTVIRNDPLMRKIFKLNTQDPGIYTTDVHINTIGQLIDYCDSNSGYTPKKCYALVAELNNFETDIKDILQHYGYFIRVGMKQKPDISIATQKYKNMVDGMTVEQLKEVVGRNHKIDFENIMLIEEDAENDDLEEDFQEEDDEE